MYQQHLKDKRVAKLEEIKYVQAHSKHSLINDVGHSSRSSFHDVKESIECESSNSTYAEESSESINAY